MIYKAAKHKTNTNYENLVYDRREKSDYNFFMTEKTRVIKQIQIL